MKKECVLIFSKAAWLCEMATGQAVYQRPLTRVNILNEIRQRVINNEDSAADGKMAALAFDDDEDDDEKLETPKSPKTTGVLDLEARLPVLSDVDGEAAFRIRLVLEATPDETASQGSRNGSIWRTSEGRVRECVSGGA